MNSTNFKAVKVPFATKKYYSSKSTSKSNKYKIWGYAYYIYDPLTGNIGKQFLQIEGADYRPTDEKMRKPTKHYKQLQKKEYSRKFREDYLTIDNFKLNYQVETLNNEAKIKFNELSFKYFNKAKTNIDLLTGSNSTGSKGINSRVEFKYYNFNIKEPKNDEFNLHNFADFFNSIDIFEHEKLEKIKLENLEIISLKKYLDTFKDNLYNEKYNSARTFFNYFNYYIIGNEEDFKEIFEIINSTCQYDDTKLEIKKIDKKDKISLKNKKDIENSIDETIEEYKESLITANKLKTRLRIRQKNLVAIEFIELKENNIIETNISSHLLKGNSKSQDHAHIISVQKCFENEDYKWIADSNNCLLIPKMIHSTMTDNEFSFNPEGNLIDREFKIISNVKIAEAFLNKKRIDFLKKNHQNWKKYKENV